MPQTYVYILSIQHPWQKRPTIEVFENPTAMFALVNEEYDEQFHRDFQAHLKDWDRCETDFVIDRVQVNIYVRAPRR